MQKQRNTKQARVDNKYNLRSNAQISKRFERSLALMHENSSLSNIACRLGDNACAAKHLAVSRRTGLLQTKNGHQKAHAFLRLQQQYGNRFVNRMMSQHAVQTKLKIGEPGDRYEQEADFVADKVMSMPDPQVEGLGGSEEDQDGLFLQKEMATTPSEAAHSPGGRVGIPKEGGEPLPVSEKAFFETRFGFDFSDARIHTGSAASETAQALQAKAFTADRHIVFGSGQYAPGTADGRKLMAHELTHFIQQRPGRAG